MTRQRITTDRLDNARTVHLYFDRSEGDYTCIAVQTHYREEDGRVTELGKVPVLLIGEREVSAIDLAHEEDSANVSFDSAAVGEW